ncbi:MULTISPECIES: peptidase inhibitor family I36 protein [Streptomyces]|uniref:Peptidase inhibitor family I36 protein n=1 Tax=Streptomyces katrae TaxID=68223 RepID=A0ABT7GVQ6_9ACTN|nr:MULTISPECIES: peptidase inhibitor family I36 protein [Streptomyces]MDK9497677.1 peptidase inhibitor family I36 protein [Streptomyces katrae]RST08828.1 hypothetical protein EF910_00915 [Streptomyces sp. WAC07149]GLX19706.1 hypothetical protein Slala01_33500 [Streptomyces lavendulae subsp. lavendulae]GLX27201.1 hypothetical protein Slala02_30210 [Streptomyces lavendulae subsp. lavendulae]
MSRGKLSRRMATAAAVAAAGLALAGVATSPAAAAGGKVQGWKVSTSPYRCTGDVCLYYSPGAEGAIWAKTSFTDYNLSDNRFWSDQYGSAGSGQSVNDNAASQENNTAYTLYTYTGANMTGSVAWTPAWYGGNLGAVGMRNTVSSYEVR